MEVMNLGQTSLPMEVILEYLDSLKEIYRAENYDLFAHNCNNFSNDFAMFLVGKGIPDHITSLPQTVLNTPFGRMLKPQIDAAMRPITQAPVPQQAGPSRNAVAGRVTREAVANAAASGSSALNGGTQTPEIGKTHNVTSIGDVERLLDSAKSRCAVIFFTSSTCAPCKLVYQPYDDLAAETGEKCVFIKIDLNYSDHSIRSKFPVRATPTFFTYLRGQKRDEWSGADPRQLRNNVEMLIREAFPPHPHLDKSVITFLRQSQRPITYVKMPPLEKLVAKMGPPGQDPAVQDIVSFLRTREREGSIEAPLPSLPKFADFIKRSVQDMPLDILFTAIDLLRLALIDPRVAGFFAEEHKGATGTPATIACVLEKVQELAETAPYPLRLTTLQMACNLFTSPLFVPHLFAAPLAALLIDVLTTALLDDKHPALRASALALAMNISAANHKIRIRSHSSFSSTEHAHPETTELEESLQVELLASLLEILGLEDDAGTRPAKGFPEAKKMALLSVGWLAYCAPMDGEVHGLWRVMDADGTVSQLAEKDASPEDRLLVKEIKGLLEV